MRRVSLWRPDLCCKKVTLLDLMYMELIRNGLVEVWPLSDLFGPGGASFIALCPPALAGL
jgi:hypothetical protein